MSVSSNLAPSDSSSQMTRLHAHQVDQALEVVLRSDRKLDRHRPRAKPLNDVVETLEEVGADLVHLVGEHDPRHAVLVALAPDRLGLRLDALVGIEHAHRAVEHPQRALDLDGEIHMAGSVDDVEALFAPIGGGRGGRDRDATLLLLLHPVHGGGALMDLAHLVAAAGIEEDPLGRRRLAGIDVGHDAEVAVVLDLMGSRHQAGLFGVVTSDSARTRGWLRPSGGYPRAS